MFKILSPEAMWYVRMSTEFNRGDPTTRYKVIAQAQLQADAKTIMDFLQGQCQNQDHFLVGYGRCDCHECIDDILRALKKLGTSRGLGCKDAV